MPQRRKEDLYRLNTEIKRELGVFIHIQMVRQNIKMWEYIEGLVAEDAKRKGYILLEQEKQKQEKES